MEIEEGGEILAKRLDWLRGTSKTHELSLDIGHCAMRCDAVRTLNSTETENEKKGFFPDEMFAICKKPFFVTFLLQIRLSFSAQNLLLYFLPALVVNTLNC